MFTAYVLVLYTTGATLHQYAYFGRGSGPIFMRNVQCTGRETRLTSCYYSTSTARYCSHYRDIGVECPGELFPGVHDTVLCDQGAGNLASNNAVEYTY